MEMKEIISHSYEIETFNYLSVLLDSVFLNVASDEL